jgi:ATP-dependent RNA helicase DeaD
MTFADLQAPAPLLLAIAARGYDTPTPVQEAVLAPALRGRDLLVSSRTGSGKTLAFGLLLAREMLAEGEVRLPRARAPLALVVAPTRELALQVSVELGWVLAPAGASIATCVGGTDVGRELRALRAGAHVVVGTPGRLVDHLERKSLQLISLRALVLDEADEMLDMGFREELERILRDAPAERRTLLFSATIPAGIESLARTYQRDAARVAATPPRQAHLDIEVRAHLIAAREREHAVVNTLRSAGAQGAIVFCATRQSVNHLHANLVERGFEAVALSGELTQSERTRALKALRDGRARVLVATDVAARGLDLPDVGIVVQADLPQNAEVFQHRSGRTGRAGKKGVSVLLVPAGSQRTAERMLQAAGVRAAWSEVASPDEVRKKDRVRLLSDIDLLSREPLEEDLEVARQLLRERTPEQLCAALVKLRREELPAPEELPLTAQVQATAPRPSGRRAPAARALHFATPHSRAPHPTPREPLKAESAHAAQRPPPHAASGAPRKAPGHAPVSEGVWFRVNVGRSRNADPRWLLPLICRRGGVVKDEIGKIRIQADETRFEIAAAAVRKFEIAARKPDKKDPGIQITRVPDRE